ncbi:class II fructose-bisphosphate aldolase [Mycolicibacterium flavescens]|uniref:Fructose-bisphosphate aldolase n=1 Tax=Mycolicibacterium flavescens TaxID=1776 RepID=A0A1E3RQT8_MYCFV|nr:class II fructose-bisphosphate aldolase [Mycolicibacterium flavescens]MCV7279542.1 class II fructose-bisphosphate aldolase [Mycolicibacterium flavescens]ODQ92201.1 fructose-bisphosphate aldolase [Mycolicibacterium flavescens]
MPLASTAALLDGARSRDVGVAAFNVITLEHAEGIIAGAERVEHPVILQVSENTVRFHARLTPLAAALSVLAADAAVPVSLHLDHVETDALWEAAGQAGFSSVMVDAGAQPYDRNVDITAAAARRLQNQGLSVEAELGYVGGKSSQASSAHTPGVRTDPQQAAEFVAATGVDALAVAVGSSHAMTTQTASLDLDLIAALRDAVPVPLVLHGSSGVPDDTLRAAVRAGIVKVNVGTALNVAYTGVLRATLSEDTVDPRVPLTAARDAVADAVSHLLGVVTAA